MPQIYLKHVSILGDARFAAAEGIDFISFLPQEVDHTGISLDKAVEIANWVNGPQIGLHLTAPILQADFELWNNDLEFNFIDTAVLFPKNTGISIWDRGQLLPTLDANEIYIIEENNIDLVKDDFFWHKVEKLTPNATVGLDIPWNDLLMKKAIQAGVEILVFKGNKTDKTGLFDYQDWFDWLEVARS